MGEWETLKSIIQNKKECYITGATVGLHSHHIFGGANRDNSERYGLKVYLIPELHNMSKNCVHYNRELMDLLHRAGQMAFERKWGTRDAFVKIFGKNYLEE